jgi:hypothetical protein
MEIYKINTISLSKVLLVGNCHGKFRPLVKMLKENLAIKEEDRETPNPKKAEIIEKVKEHQLRCVLGRRGRHESELGASMSSLLTSSSLISENKYREKSGNFSNSLIIFTGNCGIGCDDMDYNEYFTKLNKILEYNNTFVMFIRGNDDNPSYFDGKSLNLSNIKAIPDYSIIEVGGKNMLCIGGGLSINRLWKKDHEKKLNSLPGNIKKTLYWENEVPVFDADVIKEIAKNITELYCVVSHSAPSFVAPDKELLDDTWSDVDKALINDTRATRITYDRIFFSLQENGIKPNYWAYGHFTDASYIEKKFDVIFRALPDGSTPLITMQSDIMHFMVFEKKTEKRKRRKDVGIKKIEDNDDIFVSELMFNTDAEPGELRADRVPLYFDYETVTMEAPEGGRMTSEQVENAINRIIGNYTNNAYTFTNGNYGTITTELEENRAMDTEISTVDGTNQIIE